MQEFSSDQDEMAINRALANVVEQALAVQIHWFGHDSDDCIPTDWRVLPFTVVLGVRDGEYQCDLADDAGSAVRAGAGEALLIPAGCRHRLRVDEPTVADGLHIHFTLFHSLDVLSYYQLPRVVSGVDAAALLRCVDELTGSLKQNARSPSLGTIALQRSACYRLFHELLALSRKLPGKELHLVQANRILPALELIDSRLGEPLKLDTLASACALSRNAFSRLFKQVVGTSPAQYVKQTRLENAMSRLVYDNAPIADIAKTLGYCDQFHFSKTFRLVTGQSPSEYRRSVRETLPGSL